MNEDAKRSEKRYPCAGIGYPIGFDEVAEETLELLSQEGKEIQFEEGGYLTYTDPSGAQLWGFSSADGFGPLLPYFKGAITYHAFLNVVVRNLNFGFKGIGASCGEEGIASMEDAELFMAVMLPIGHMYKDLRDQQVLLKVTAIPKTGVKLIDFSMADRLWKEQKEAGIIPFLASDFVRDENGAFPPFEGSNEIFLMIRKVSKHVNTSNGREFLHVIGEVNNDYLLDVVVETIFFPGEVLPGRAMYGTFNLYGMIVDEYDNVKYGE